MSEWANGRLCAFDLETDGPDPLDARIVTATVILLGPRGTTPHTHRWLLKTERPIPLEATAVHGITTEEADRDGVNRLEGIDQITDKLTKVMGEGVPVIAFNAAYDLTVIDREARRVGLAALIERLGGTLGPVVDPHVIDKAVDRYRRGKRTLGATCQVYGVELGNAHDSDADALGAARLAYKLASKFEEVGAVELGELHEMQVSWRAAQCASLQDYFRRQGRTDVVDPSWPMIPLAGAEVAS